MNFEKDEAGTSVLEILSPEVIHYYLAPLLNRKALYALRAVNHYFRDSLNERFIESFVSNKVETIYPDMGPFYQRTFFITRSGELLQCGDGNSQIQSISIPAPIRSVTGCSSYLKSNRHYFAIDANHALWAWGCNDNGQLGTGDKQERQTPIKVLENVKQVVTRRTFTVAVKRDGTVWSWGNNDSEWLGLGHGKDQYFPQQILALSNIKKIIIASGISNPYCFAISEEGRVFAWGENVAGQLGLSHAAGRQTTPQQVDALSEIEDIVAGGGCAIAITKDGNLWGWGRNNLGQLGFGDIGRCYPPQLISGPSNIVNVVLSSREHGYVAAIQQDGKIWMWGKIYSEKVISTPKQVTNLDNVISITSGYNHTLVLKNDGTVWGWGGNDLGQLGCDFAVHLSIQQPQQIPNLTNAVELAAGYRYTVVRTRDGMILACGDNENGQLGLNTKSKSNVLQGVPFFNKWQVPAKHFVRQQMLEQDWKIPASIRLLILQQLHHFISVAQKPSLIDQVKSTFYSPLEIKQINYAKGLQALIRHKDNYNKIKVEIESTIGLNKILPKDKLQSDFHTCLLAIKNDLEKAKNDLVEEAVMKRLGLSPLL